MIPRQPSGFGCPCHGGQYDTEGNRTAGPPVRALDRYSFSIVNGHLFLGAPFSVSNVDGTGATARDLQARSSRSPACTSTGLESWLYPIQPPRTDGDPTTHPPGADPVPARLARGALGARRRDPLLPLPERPARHQLVPDARLGDADRLHRPGDDRRDPRDVLPAGPDDRVPVDPAHHERPLGRLARPRHAPVGRVGVHHPDVPAHGARLPLRRLQVPARAELDASACCCSRSGSPRASPATCCRGTRRRTGRPPSGSTSTARRRSSGRFLAQFLQGGTYINADTISRFYAIHMLVLPGRDRGLIALHLYLVIRLGVTSPPWSKDAAGTGPLDPAGTEPAPTRPGRRRPGAASNARGGVRG